MGPGGGIWSSDEKAVVTASFKTRKLLKDGLEIVSSRVRSLGMEPLSIDCLDAESGYGRHWQVLDIFPGCNEEAILEKCAEMTHSPVTKEAAEQDGLELVFQPAWLMAQHTKPGLAVFDMDSTLIQQEVIDELARKIGKYDQVAAITEAAMRGELDFEASLRARVKELKGVPVGIWDELKRDIITFTPGAKDLTKVLKREGWNLAVLSGGFMPLATWVRDTLGLDHAFANELVVDEAAGILTGELVPGAPIVHATRKRELLEQLAAQHGIPMKATIAVGDGSNDLLMMKRAGLGVALNAKPRVQAEAPARVNGESLVEVLFLLGYTKEGVDWVLRRT